MKKSNFYNYLFSALCVSLLGVFIAFLFFKTSSYALNLLGVKLEPSKVAISEDEVVVKKTDGLRVSPITYNKFTPPKSGKVIYINTEFNIVSQYLDGKMIGSFNILSLNKEMPLVYGEYTVFKKELSHKSARTDVILPNVVAFAPNYFIYGWTEGNVKRRGSAIIPESIGLDVADAIKVYSFADMETKVIVESQITQRDLTREDRDLLGFEKPAEIAPDLLKKLSVNSKAFLIKDLDTGENILNKNEVAKMPIASVTKLVTAIVALDNLDEDSLVKISKSALNTYGQQGYLSLGEKLKVIDLVNCLLLVSSNDASEALAEHFGRDKFILLMNEKVKALGMQNTSFLDPSGLSKGNQSTPEDLSKLVAYIEDNRPDILAITKKKTYEVPASSLSKKHTWLNINRLIRDNNSYYLGGKDGFTGDALMTFVGAFSVPLTEFDHKRFSIALLKSSDRNGDIKKIIDKIISSLQFEDGLSFKSIMDKRRGKYVTPIADKNLSLMFVGDIMLDRGVKQLIEKHGGSDYLFPFEFVPFLKDPDIVFGNLEGPVSDVGYDIGNLYSFRMDPKALSALKEAGFDVLSVANNHIGDWGLSAFEDTLKRLRESGITAIGGGFNGQDARAVKIIEKNGIKIGFLGFSDVGPEWVAGKEDLPTILLANDPAFETIIKNAVAKVDYLIVSFHFGEEYKTESNERQRYLAHKAVDAGAKIVIGHHPHVIQELEKYKDGVIAYSLGNFVFDQAFSQETLTGGVLEIILDKEGILQINESKVLLNDYFQPVLMDGSGV